ncbi:hypothetical protein PIB30_099668, partial [Stylosanthes scabra]|nr:hypothetical protein [Stylosanthes scabra]
RERKNGERSRRSILGMLYLWTKLEFVLDTFRKQEWSSSLLKFPAVEPATVGAEPLVDVFPLRVILKAEKQGKVRTVISDECNA